MNQAEEHKQSASFVAERHKDSIENPMVGAFAAYLLKVVSVDDDIETTQLSQSELVLIHTGIADLLPGPWAVGLAGSLHSRLELVQSDQTAGQASIVGNVGKQDASCLIETLIKDPVSNALQDTRHSQDCTREYLAMLQAMGIQFQGIMPFWHSSNSSSCDILYCITFVNLQHIFIALRQSYIHILSVAV